MKPSHARLLAWGVLLALVVLGGAAALSGRTPRQEAGPAETRAVRIVAEPGAIATGADTALSVRAEDGSGAAVDAWGGSALEAWLVRTDLAYAARIAAGQGTSSLTIPLRPTQPGSYRLVVAGAKAGLVTLGGTAIQVRGRAEDVGPDEQSASRAGYAATMRSIPEADDIVAGAPAVLTVSVSRDGTPVPLEERDGARGSLMAFREGGNLAVRGTPESPAFLPSPAATAFAMTFPEPGRYRAFLAFEAGGQPLMHAWWIEVRPAR